MIAAGANYLKYLITGDASQLKKELADAQQGINNLGGGGAGNSMRTVSGQMDAMAMSAKQLNAATRGLPAQFTDIFVSLQGGQAPLTVLLQQGGQLKDLFGGIMPAAKAMGGYILGLVNPYSLAAAAVIALGAAYYQGSQEADVWRKAMVTSGNAVGVTSSELRGYAQQLDGVAGTQHAAAMALGEMVQAGVAGGAQLRDYTQAAMAWESATGQAVGETAKQFKSLAKEPLEGVLKLNEGTNFLTLELYEQIKALDEQGRTTEAARLAQDAYAETLNDRGAQIKQNLGSIERAWSGITGAAKKAWDAMLNVGRPATLEEQLAEVEKKLEVALANQSWGETGGGAATGRVNNAYVKQVQEEIRLLGERKWALMDRIDAERMGAAASEHNAKAVAAQADWDKVVISNLDKKAKMERELAEVRQKAAAAGVAGAELEGQLAAVREKYAEKAKKASTATQTAYETLMSTINQKIVAMQGEVATGEKLTETEKLRARYGAEINDKDRQYTAQQRAKLEAGLALLDQEEKKVIAARELAKAQEEGARALDRVTQQREKQLETLQSNLQKLQLEEEAHAYAAASGITHAEAVERLTIARLEEHLAMARQGTESQATIDWLERELAARRQIAEVMGQRGVREANEKAQKELEKDWERISKTIGQTLSDYIMGGGKDAATYLKRLFATLVLQPVVNYGVQGVMGALGVGQAGTAAGGAANPLGLLQSGQSLWSAFSGGLSGTLATGVTQLGSLMGSSFLGELGAGIAAGGQLGIGGTASLIGSAGGTTGVGMTIGAAAPWIAGAAALYSIIKSFDNSGTPHMGAGAIYSGGQVSDGRDIYNRATFGMGAAGEWSSSNQVAISGIAGTLGGALDGFAKAFGKEAGYTVATAFADDSSDDGAWGSLRIADALGNVLTDWEQSRSSKWAPKTFANGEEGYKQYLAAVAVDVKTAMLAMDLPGWANQLLNAATDLDTLNAALGQIAANKAGFDALASSMSMFKGISEELQTQLLTASGGMDVLTSSAAGYYSAFYSEAERMESLSAQVQSALAGLDISLDPRMGEAAKQQFAATVEAAMAAGQGELAVKLLAMSQSFATAADYAAKAASDAAKAAADARQGAWDSAMANLEAAVDRERSYWQSIQSAAQNAISTLSSTLNLLTSNARELYGTVDGTAQMLAAQGMVYIESALDAVRGGASVTDYGQLQEAISAARGGINSGAYVSLLDRERDTLLLANQLSELGGLTDSQLTVQDRQLRAAESQIERLDETLAYWQQALSYDQLQIDATMSVGQAVAALGPLLAALQSADASTYASAITAVTSRTPEEKAALYQQMRAAGLSDTQIRDQVNKTTGQQTDADWDYLRKLAGVPGFATGGDHLGGLRIVGERGWELEATGPSRIWNQQQLAQALGGGSRDSSRTDALLAEITSSNRRLADKLSAVEDENRRMRTVLEAIARGEVVVMTQPERTT